MGSQYPEGVKYQLTLKNPDGSTWQIIDYIPPLNDEDILKLLPVPGPAKPSDSLYDYTFDKWVIIDNGYHKDIQPTYTSSLIIYTVIWISRSITIKTATFNASESEPNAPSNPAAYFEDGKRWVFQKWNRSQDNRTIKYTAVFVGAALSTWNDLESAFKTWNELESGISSWNDIAA